MPQDKDFVAFNNLQVIIPYSEYEKVVNMAHELEEIKKQNSRIEEQYAAIRGMFSEVLEVVRDFRDFVKD